MTTEKRLLEVFRGSGVAHGRTTVGRTGRNGKAEAKSKVVREPLTEEAVRLHIEGTQGIGSIPINSDNMCRFGALDIDTYDLNHKALSEKLKKLKLPLFHCRSKSGGAHLFLFLKDWEPAALVREYLMEMSIALGFSGCEIFPKQDKILAVRGDVGNFINMPYFNAEETMRYCFNKKAEAMELPEFLAAVDKGKVSASELNEMTLGGKREHFTDGPYCLEVMTSQGAITEFRNIFMFAVGVYCRMKWPDDWKKHHEEYNRMLCKPALGAGEIINIQKSLEKKEYYYQCDVCPLKDHCDKDLCKTRPFGVGTEAPDAAHIGGLTILLSEPRLYFMDVDGRRIQLTTEQLQNQMLWQRACMEQIDLMPPIMKPQKWQATVNSLMNNSTKLAVPEELTLSGQFRDHIKNFCTSRIRAMAPEELEMGKPWTEDGVTKFKIEGLMDYLKNRDWRHWSKAQVQEGIKDLNGSGKCHGHQNIMKQGKRTTIRVWFVPAFDYEEPKKENDNDEIPF